MSGQKKRRGHTYVAGVRVRETHLPLDAVSRVRTARVQATTHSVSRVDADAAIALDIGRAGRLKWRGSKLAGDAVALAGSGCA